MSAGPGLSQKELERSDYESSREPYTSLEFMPSIKICSGAGAELGLCAMAGYLRSRVAVLLLRICRARRKHGAKLRCWVEGGKQGPRLV